MPIDDTGAWLESLSAPALLVDPRAQRLVGANAAGAARICIANTRSMELDRSMPGWMTIAAYADTGPFAQPCQKVVLFWTSDGPQAMAVQLERVRRSEQSLVLLTFGREASGSPLAPQRSVPAAGAGDLAILRDIARRIRSGLISSVPGDVMPAAPGTTASAITGPTEQRCTLRLDVQRTEQHANAALHSDLAPTKLAVLAHELRTPLSAIVSLSEIMRDERLGSMRNPKYRDYAADIHESARHTLELIGAMVESEGLADASPVPALKFAVIDINEVARGCSSAMQPIAAGAGLDLRSELGFGLPLVTADRRAIRQIVLNLLSNALRMTPRGGSVTIATRLEPDHSLTLEVSDTGAGMLQSDIARALGGPGDATRFPEGRLEGSGSGIGLPLVRQLANGHGARLSIESTLGEGSRIAVNFGKDRLSTR